MTQGGAGAGGVRGWVPAVLAVAAGLLLYAGHPPLDQGWAGVLALAPLVALARLLAQRPGPAWRGAGWGLIAGVVFFAPLLYWIGRFGIVPLIALVLIQAAFVAAYVAVLAAWGPRRGRAALAIVGWVALEAVRSVWPFGGFAWGLLGLTQHLGGPLLPVARTLGVLGVSLACAAVAVGLEAVVWRARAALAARGGRPVGERLAAAVRAPLAGVVAVFAAAIVLGADAPAATGETVDAAAVQGNDQELPPLMDQDEGQRIERVADRMVVATEALAGQEPPDFAVWPENSLDADTRTNVALRARVETAVELIGGAPLLAGTVLQGTDGGREITMVRYDDDADIAETYVKRRLVPFGEFVPLRWLVGWYPTVRDHLGPDAVPGEHPGVFDVDGVDVGPITCYESIYPDVVGDQVRAGAQVLVVSTNNASYGRTAATWQHLAHSRVRAVETGRWVLHAGVSGVSAVVDPEGRTSQETPLYEQAIVRADLPLVDDDTVFTRTGDLVGPTSMALGLAALAWLLLGRLRGGGG